MSKESCKKSRRDFLKKGMAGLASASLLPSLIQAKDRATSETESKGKGEKKIIVRTLGGTGLKVPIVGYGCGNTDNPNLIRAALDEGIAFLDTANIYQAGGNEAMLGEILKGRSRNSFVIATKILLPLDVRTGLVSENTDPVKFKAEFKKKLDESLKRLRLDYVDILYLHRIIQGKALAFKPAIDVMLELKKEGKARFLGVSFHKNEPAMIRATVEQKIYDVILTSYNFRQPHKEEVNKAIAYAAKAGIGVVAMKVMAGVFWDRERKHPINAKAALKWVLQDENIHTAIPGISTFDELETDMSVMEDLRLTPQEKSDLRFGEKTAMTGLYCAQCGRCRSQCRYKLDIPTMMRSYMYAYGYQHPTKAKETLLGIDKNEIICRECGACAVSCTMGFDVPGKIKDITRILDIPDDFLV